MLYVELVDQIIACANKVHADYEVGSNKLIYQRALGLEMALKAISHASELEMMVYYKGIEVGTRKVDLYVEDRIVIDLMFEEKLEDYHRINTMKYCKAIKQAHGLLINFGAEILEFERVYNLSYNIN